MCSGKRREIESLCRAVREVLSSIIRYRSYKCLTQLRYKTLAK